MDNRLIMVCSHQLAMLIDLPLLYTRLLEYSVPVCTILNMLTHWMIL